VDTLRTLVPQSEFELLAEFRLFLFEYNQLRTYFDRVTDGLIVDGTWRVLHYYQIPFLIIVLAAGASRKWRKGGLCGWTIRIYMGLQQFGAQTESYNRLEKPEEESLLENLLHEEIPPCILLELQ
jgi:hypothetical protein